MVNVPVMQTSVIRPNVHSSAISSVAQESMDRAIGGCPVRSPDAVYDEALDFTAYMKNRTHVRLIQDNELISCELYGQQSPYGPGRTATVLPQSLIDDAEDWS